MKITKSRMREIIKEEYDKLNEGRKPLSGIVTALWDGKKKVKVKILSKILDGKKAAGYDMDLYFVEYPKGKLNMIGIDYEEDGRISNFDDFWDEALGISTEKTEKLADSFAKKYNLTYDDSVL